MREKLARLFAKLDWYDFFLIIVLLAAFFARVQFFNMTMVLYGGDGDRDYLVAHHIVRYHEFPLAGPANSVLDPVKNSPLYFYLLAGVLLMRDDPAFLGYVSIFLNLISIAFIYILAKRAFGAGAALLAALFMSFLPSFVTQAHAVWQPTVMLPFLYGSLILLLSAYVKKKFSLLLISIFLFALAGIVHNSAFGLFLPYLVAAALVGKEHMSKLARLAWIFTVFAGTIILSYLPVFFYLSKHEVRPAGALAHIIASSRPSSTFFDLLDRFAATGQSLLRFFSIEGNSLVLSIIGLGGLASLILWPRGREHKKRVLFFLLIASLVMGLTPIALLGQKVNEHYLVPFVGLFAVLMGVSLWVPLSGSLGARVAGISLGLWVLLISQSFSFWTHPPPATNQRQVLHEAADAIGAEVVRIQGEEGRATPHFFQIRFYRSGSQGVLSAVLWEPLEKKLSTRLVQVDDWNGDNLAPLASSTYIFLACLDDAANRDLKECQRSFLAEEKKASGNDYAIVRGVYEKEPLTVYLAKRRS